MAKTTAMRLVELMIMKEDISRVIEFLGKKGNFQFQTNLASAANNTSKEKSLFEALQKVRAYLNIQDLEDYAEEPALPEPKDFDSAESLIASVNSLRTRETEKSEELKRITSTYKEALAFANLKASYSELEHLSFLTLRIGKIDPAIFDELKFAVGDRAVIIPLGDDKSRIMAASSKKGRFALDGELKKYGFVAMEVPKDFKGVPDDVLASLKEQVEETEKITEACNVERHNFAETHKAVLYHLLSVFSVGMQVKLVEDSLESTQLVYRVTGWIPAEESRSVLSELDKLSEGRIAIREYTPNEVPAVIAGHEKVPVSLKHGKFIGSFERIIFSYGSPLYGTIDPTPFVAIFFTILFGIMFGDAGQGLVFLLLGILMETKIAKVGGWNKFAPVFIAIGVSSCIMGLLTGEFFATETVLEPFSRFVTGLFGEPRHAILPMMPTGSKESIIRMFTFFGFTVGVGFVINSVGLLLNICNQFALGKKGKALFGKTGLSGAMFFWFVVFVAIKVFLLKKPIIVLDWVIIGLTLFCSAFGEVLERIVDNERPILENGLLSAIIGAVVELLETVITYLSNSVSFLRVGAFALSHAVLGTIISRLMEIVPLVTGKVLVGIVGNGIVIVLEGMIVAIQVMRLQYYEFFSKFFNETGREFKPFKFEYNAQI